MRPRPVDVDDLLGDHAPTLPPLDRHQILRRVIAETQRALGRRVAKSMHAHAHQLRRRGAA